MVFSSFSSFFSSSYVGHYLLSLFEWLQNLKPTAEKQNQGTSVPGVFKDEAACLHTSQTAINSRRGERS